MIMMMMLTIQITLHYRFFAYRLQRNDHKEVTSITKKKRSMKNDAKGKDQNSANDVRMNFFSGTSPSTVKPIINFREWNVKINSESSRFPTRKK